MLLKPITQALISTFHILFFEMSKILLHHRPQWLLVSVLEECKAMCGNSRKMTVHVETSARGNKLAFSNHTIYLFKNTSRVPALFLFTCRELTVIIYRIISHNIMYCIVSYHIISSYIVSYHHSLYRIISFIVLYHIAYIYHIMYRIISLSYRIIYLLKTSP